MPEYLGRIDASTEAYLDHGEDKLILKKTEDLTGILEQTKNLNPGKKVKLAARIPTILVDIYCLRRGISFRDWVRDPEHIKHMLKDPALAHFRVWRGKI